MALNLYLDDCSNSDLLADLLRQAGHRVARPTDDGVGLDGEDDQVHFGFAAAHGLTIITKNPADFKALHDLDQRHSGILAVYQPLPPFRRPCPMPPTLLRRGEGRRKVGKGWSG